jgi:hypothetical protein
MATTEHVRAAEIVSATREISDALTDASRLVEVASQKSRDLWTIFDSAREELLPRFEHAVDSMVQVLALNLGADLGDGMSGNFDLESVTDDARELVELVEMAVKGRDHV